MNEKIIDVYDYINDKNELIVITIVKKDGEYLVEKCKNFKNKIIIINRFTFKKLNDAKEKFIKLK